MSTNQAREKYSAARRLVFLLLCLPNLFFAVPAAQDLCGATIVTHLELQQDLLCAGDALIIGADGITVNLNGFTIQGSGAGVGITITGRTQVAVTGGTIRNFAFAVRTGNASLIKITGNLFTDNAEGVDLGQFSTGVTVTSNEFRNHPIRAIMIRGNSTLHTIWFNTFTDNRIGVLVFGGVNNVISENRISGSQLAGIRLNVFATGNLISGNELTSNVAGLEFLATPTAATVGNTLAKNTLAMNSCGLKGPTADNTFTRNVFVGNTTDTCP